MKIKDIRLEEKGEKVVLSACCKIRKLGWDTAWFEFDKEYKDYIVVDASPFVTSLIVPSMRHGEDLIVEGDMSEKLYENMQELMQIMLGWEVMRLHKINLKVSSLNRDVGDPTGISSSFSGGVDSFYTFLKHRRGIDKITHLVVVDGFDIDLRNKALWKVTVRNVEEVGDAEGVQVIKARTNIKELIEPMISWEDSCGGGLAAVSMCLRGGIRMLYLPGGFSAEQQYPGGTTLMTDHLWSTEKFKSVHDGAEARRVDKVINLVGDSPLALRHLRVCHDNLAGIYNCGECDKCFRTMVSLTITGTLDQSETFPRKLNRKKLANLKIPSEYAALFHRENVEELAKRGIEPETQKILNDLLKDIDVPPQRKETFLERMMYLDHTYNKGILRRIARPMIGNKF
jgi:hypothetical protein